MDNLCKRLYLWKELYLYSGEYYELVIATDKKRDGH